MFDPSYPLDSCRCRSDFQVIEWTQVSPRDPGGEIVNFRYPASWKTMSPKYLKSARLKVSQSDQTNLEGSAHGLAAVAGIQLLEDVSKVRLD